MQPPFFYQTSSLSAAKGARQRGARLRELLRNFCATRPTELSGLKKRATMDLQKTAEAESERRTRSKLEEHREAIFALRRKHWTYARLPSGSTSTASQSP